MQVHQLHAKLLHYFYGNWGIVYKSTALGRRQYLPAHDGIISIVQSIFLKEGL